MRQLHALLPPPAAPHLRSPRRDSGSGWPPSQLRGVPPPSVDGRAVVWPRWRLNRLERQQGEFEAEMVKRESSATYMSDMEGDLPGGTPPPLQGDPRPKLLAC